MTLTDRDTYIKLLRTALIAHRADFARQIAMDWLAVWPGDLDVQVMLARAEMEIGALDSATQRLKDIVILDPEATAAYQMLASALRSQGQALPASIYDACALALKGLALDPRRHPAWAIRMGEIRKALAQGRPQDAAHMAQEVLAADHEMPLPAWIVVQATMAAGDEDSAIAYARYGHQKWPSSLPFLILLGDHWVRQGDPVRGLSLLHQAARADTQGRITARILGDRHAYHDLWPKAYEAALSRPIPADVAAVLGENRLMGADGRIAEAGPPAAARDSNPRARAPRARRKTDATAHSPTGFPEPQPWEAFQGPDPGKGEIDSADMGADQQVISEVQREFARLAARLNARRRLREEDGRSPAYILLSSHTRLQQVLGVEAFQAIDQSMLALLETVRKRPGWSAYRLYVDDPDTLQPFGLSPTDPGNAWQIKLRLADLDQALEKRGEMIGAVLIVGGHDIVPFHLLPNPTDDDDEHVPSDNPYATSDENYFMPEWPVGRLPFDKDAESLVKALQRAASDHRAAQRSLSLGLRLRLWLRRKMGRVLAGECRTLGYTASIWRRASIAVYKAIGDPRSMISSPPVEAERLPSHAVKAARLSYYNLHGLEGSPEWYGQRDPLHDQSVTTEFPVALRPQDVVNGGRAPKVVFTEACYGANSIGKTAETALSLKFLASGSRAVIGSTKISYGSVTPPLIAADLLGRLFWQYLNQHLPVGEALRRAKLKYAAEMHGRQGFLDGEDQKTLISFVLYGDPLFRPDDVLLRPGEKAIIRSKARPATPKTACALGGPELSQNDLDPSTMEKIEAIVAQYLPGMQKGLCRIRAQHVHCEGEGHNCPTHDFTGAKKLGHDSGEGALVVTLAKRIPDGQIAHPYYAHLTIGPNGKIMKLAVSR